jgi:hypothetical protein
MKTTPDSSTGKTTPVVGQHVALSAIDFDPTVQVRAEINMTTVRDYAECMEAGDRFPALDLFIDGERYWIGDGWHRALALKENGTVTCRANVHEGGRLGAIKFALQANTKHGLRRTHADMWKAIRVALKEFPNLSDRQLGEMCGVDHETVAGQRPHVAESATSPTRTDTLGRQQPATKPKTKPKVPEAEPTGGKPNDTKPDPLQVFGKPQPGLGVFYAGGAIDQLEKISPTDPERIEALTTVRDWCNKQLGADGITESLPPRDAATVEEGKGPEVVEVAFGRYTFEPILTRLGHTSDEYGPPDRREPVGIRFVFPQRETVFVGWGKGFFCRRNYRKIKEQMREARGRRYNTDSAHETIETKVTVVTTPKGKP